MRILFVTPVVPSRAYGRRPFNFLRCLRGRHDLFLATFLTNRRYDTPCLEELASWGIRTFTVQRPRYASAATCLLAPAVRWPLRAMFVRSRRLRTLLARLVSEFQFDIIHFDRMRMGQFAVGLDAARRVVDFTDSIPLYLERKRPFTRSPAARAIDWWERHTIPHFEEFVLRHLDAGILCSEVDTKRFLRMHPGAPIETIVNMVDPEEWKPKQPAVGDPRGVYTGTLSYEPNIDALGFLIRDIMPRVWAHLPGFELLVYGTRPGRKVMSMIRDRRVRLFADVPQLSEELSQRDIYLCPIRIGSGMRNKVLEAFSTEMAVVSTSLGCEGMGLEGGREIAVADPPGQFAREVVRLARDPAERERMGRTGRAFALKHHHPDVIGAQLEALYAKLARP